MINVPSVTVVTVTRNAERHLETTIQSVVEQTHPNIEYVVVDGNSLDGTLDIVERYGERIDRWISEPDSGIYGAMNKGVALATGSWLIFLNAGDTFCSASTIADVFANSRDAIDIIYGDTYVRGQDGSVELEKAGDLEGVMWRYNPFYHQSVFARTELMRAENFDTDFRFVADSKFIYSQYLQGRVFLRLQMPISVYLAGGVSMMNERAVWKERMRMALDFGEKSPEEIRAFYGRFTGEDL